MYGRNNNVLSLLENSTLYIRGRGGLNTHAETSTLLRVPLFYGNHLYVDNLGADAQYG